MRYILVFILLLLTVPFLTLSGYALARGYDLAAGLESIFRKLVSRDLFYSIPIVIPNQPIAAKHRPVNWNGELENEWLNEASGLAPSFLNLGVYFSINDSGNSPELFALRADGSDAGVWSIAYSDNHDFEDIAAFGYKGQRYLLIADSGDNFYWRPEVRLLILAEPDLDQMSDMPLQPAWSITYRYPLGARDVEGVAVDEASERVFLISKRQVPPELFSVPLRPEQKVITATYEGRLTGLPQPSSRDLREDPKYGRYRSLPTALAMKGRQAIVITYRDAYLFERRRTESWPDALAKVPDRIPLPDILGLEAGTFDIHRDRLLIVSERKNGVGRSGVYQIDL